MKCHLCSPPASMSLPSSGQWSTIVMNEHHVKLFHLGPYKPFKCSMPNCNQSVTIAPMFDIHAKTQHLGTIIDSANRRSEYLEALMSVMMQFNFHGSGSSPQLASDMTKSIQCGTHLPLTITSSGAAPNQIQSPTGKPKLTQNAHQQNVNMTTPATNTASKNLRTSNAGKRQIKMRPIKKKKETQYVVSKMKFCKKCKIWLSEGAVKNHLSGLRHIGKYCLQCNGCEFKAFRENARMMLHIKRKHPGAAAGYSDTTHEIMEELENEENLYIQ